MTIFVRICLAWACGRYRQSGGRKQLAEKGLLAQCYSLEPRRMGPINQMLCWHFPANAGSEKRLWEDGMGGLTTRWPKWQAQRAKLISAIGKVIQMETCCLPLPFSCGANGKKLCPDETSGLTCFRASSYEERGGVKGGRVYGLLTTRFLCTSSCTALSVMLALKRVL